MPQNSYPWSSRNSGSITDREYEDFAAHWHTDGLLPLPQGIAAAVTADCTGMRVIISAGVSMLIRGRFWTSGDMQLAVPIAPNLAALPRTDRVVVRLDRAAATATAHLIQGTPAIAALTPPRVRRNSRVLEVGWS